jgi:hypothetical protein
MEHIIVKIDELITNYGLRIDRASGFVLCVLDVALPIKKHFEFRARHAELLYHGTSVDKKHFRIACSDGGCTKS